MTVSGDFYGSPEFRSKGYFATRFYVAAFGRNPLFQEFLNDLTYLNGGTPAESDAARASFAGHFVLRDEFHDKFDGLSNADYVDRLIANTGVLFPNRNQLVDALNSNALSRAEVLAQIVDDVRFADDANNFNRAFVLAEYFGYLRRDPEPKGFQDWLNYLNSHPGDFRTMIRGFVASIEYRRRFGPA